MGQVDINIQKKEAYINVLSYIYGTKGPQGDSAVERISLEAYKTKVREKTLEDKWYLVVDDNDQIISIYLKNVLFSGSAENVYNFVVLSEKEYERLPVKEPNRFYFTYEEESRESIEGSTLFGQVVDSTLVTSGTITNKTLTI